MCHRTIGQSSFNRQNTGFPMALTLLLSKTKWTQYTISSRTWTISSQRDNQIICYNKGKQWILEMFFILLSSNTLEPFLIPLCLLHPIYQKSLLSILFRISQNPVSAYLTRAALVQATILS